MTDYISNPHHFRDLLQGVAWTDIKTEVLDIIRQSKEDMVMYRGEDDKEIYRFQGRIEALEAVLLVPEEILGSLEDTPVEDFVDDFLDE